MFPVTQIVKMHEGGRLLYSLLFCEKLLLISEHIKIIKNNKSIILQGTSLLPKDSYHVIYTVNTLFFEGSFYLLQVFTQYLIFPKHTYITFFLFTKLCRNCF